VANTVAADGSSRVQVYGYAADGTAVEGLRVGPGGAELFLGAAGGPLSAALGPLQALLAYEVAVPAPGVVALSGANTLYLEPELRFPRLGRRGPASPPIAAADFAWTASSGDPKVAAVWDAGTGRLKLTSSAAAALGSADFAAFNATVSLTAAAPGLPAAAAELQVLVRPLASSPFSLMEANLGMRRNDASAFACGGRMYVVGCGAQCYMGSRAEVFDPATRSWWRLPDAPDATKAKAGCLDGRVHVVGGTQAVNEFSVNDAHGFFHSRYDPAVNAWETLPRFPGGRPGGDMTGGAVVGAAGVAYAFADYGRPGELWGYDAGAEAWSRRADVPLDVWGACGAEWGGQLYLFGGRGRVGGVWTNHKTAYRYDAASDAWVRLADAPVSSLGGTSTACASDESTGLIYVAALIPQDDLNRELHTYDPAADVWATLPEGSGGVGGNFRVSSHLVALHGRLYFVGGSRDDGTGYVGYNEKVDVR